MPNPVLLERLNNIKKAFLTERLMDLRTLSNEIMKEAAMKNDQTLAHLAIISYCLHKFLTKEHVITSGFWIEYKMSVTTSLDSAIQALGKDDYAQYKRELDSIAAHLERLDKSIGRYVQSIYEKAKVKYAADAYYYGLSLSQAAELTRANAVNVQRYIGATKQHDFDVDKKGIARRLEEFKQIIGVGV